MRDRAEAEIKAAARYGIEGLQIDLTLIRHGATASNREGRYLGKTDEGLDEQGAEELRGFRDDGRYPYPGHLFCGPSLRCRQSARHIFPNRNICLVSDWTEMDFGRFEGKNYAELSGDTEYRRWIGSGGRLPPPGGESRESFLARSLAGFWFLASALAEKRDGSCAKREAAAVVHGGTIMALCSAFFGGDYFDYQVKNGSGYRCRLLCGDRSVSGIGIKSL